MKKFLAILIHLMIVTYCADAQHPGYKWAKGVGGDHITGQSGPFNNLLRHFYTDKKGNSYIAGEVIEGVSFGDSVLNRPYGSFGNADVVFAKYDKCGKLIWSQIYGGKPSDAATQIKLSSDEKYLFGRIGLRTNSVNDSIIIHLENSDTVIKGIWSPYLKINANTGKIIKYWNSLATPSGTPYTLGLSYPMGPNRILSYIYFTGPYNGVNTSVYERYIAVLDSNFSIVRARKADSAQAILYNQDYSLSYPGASIDKYGNIYSESILQPSNPSNVIHLFDTTFTGLAHGEGIFYQMDTNLNIKRFKKENCMIGLAVSADDNLYLTGSLNSNYFYDTTHLFGNAPNVSRTPLYMKIDTALKLVGYSYVERTNYELYTEMIKASTNEVYVAGVVFGDVKWGQDSVITIPNTYQIGLWEFSKDSLKPSNVNLSYGFGINAVLPTNIDADEQGNVNIAGTYNLILYTEGDTIAALGGANSPNIFTMHWGLDCMDSTHALVAPLAATALTATAASAHAVIVDWSDASRYEHGYHIYRSPDGISGWALIDSTGANTVQFTDASVQPNTVYWYRVAAWNESGESSVSNADSARTWMDVGIANSSPTLPYITTYPNPATDRLTIEVYSLGSKDATLALTDISGRVVAEQRWTLSEGTNKTSILMDHISTGIYSLTIRTATDLVTRKVNKM